MDLLLKEKKDNSLSTLLRRTFRWILLTVLFTGIAGIGAYSISAHVATWENHAFLLVNGFFTDLQAGQDLFYQQVLSEQEDIWEELHAFTDGLISSLEEMGDLPISTIYLRETDDLSGRMQTYAKILHQAQGEDKDTLVAAFYEAQDLVLLMQGSFPTIYQEMVKACSAYASRAAWISLAYCIVLVFTLLLLLWVLILYGAQTEKAITQPIEELAGELKEADLDLLEEASPLSCPEGACAEVKVLFTGYGSMLSKIQTQLREREDVAAAQMALHEQELLNLQMSNQLKKAQLDNLHAQINPHFLFNTLNMISQSAFMKGDRETVSLLEMTSDLLRYSLDYGDRAVTIQQEIEMLGNYVALQELRFGDRITFCFDLDESFHQTKIPNLIVQPLVENAVIHGVGCLREGAKIEIRTRYEEETGMGRIMVIDNGAGFKDIKETLDSMHSAQNVTGKDGLANAYLRLWLFFDHQADVEIASGEDGTQVCLVFPAQKDGKKR